MVRNGAPTFILHREDLLTTAAAIALIACFRQAKGVIGTLSWY